MTTPPSVAWRVDVARNGRVALRRPDGSWAESRFAPDIDAARRIAEAGVAPGERVLVLGCGAGELPAAAARAAAPGGTVIAAEPHPEIREALVAARSRAGAGDLLAACWASPGLSQLPGSPETLSDFLSAVAAAGPYDRVVVHPHLELPAGFEMLEQRLADIEVRRRSGYRFQAFLAANVATNRERFLAAPGVRELAGLLAGEDVVIAGGGPSLSPLAEAIGTGAHWIAVGTALAPLAAAGIAPHLVVITDPQPRVAASLTALDERRRPPLVCFPTTSAVAVAAAPRLIAAFPEGDGDRQLAPLREEIGELPAGGTVVTSAIGLAWILGAARIFLAGVDLVETATRSHADASPHAAERLAGLMRFASLEERARGREARLGESGDRIEVATAEGGRAHSRRNLALYARAIADLARRRPDVAVIQLNPGAIAMPGVSLDPAARPAVSVRQFLVPTGARTRENGGLLCA